MTEASIPNQKARNLGYWKAGGIAPRSRSNSGEALESGSKAILHRTGIRDDARKRGFTSLIPRLHECPRIEKRYAMIAKPGQRNLRHPGPWGWQCAPVFPVVLGSRSFWGPGRSGFPAVTEGRIGGQSGAGRVRRMVSVMEGGQDFLPHNLQLLYGLVAGAQGTHGELGGSGVDVPLD